MHEAHLRAARCAAEVPLIIAVGKIQRTVGVLAPNTVIHLRERRGALRAVKLSLTLPFDLVDGAELRVPESAVADCPRLAD